MTPLEEAKRLYLKWELHKFGCERVGELISASDFIDSSRKAVLRDYLIAVFSESLNNGVSRNFQNVSTEWRKEAYRVEDLEMANQVGNLPEGVHMVTLDKTLEDMPSPAASSTAKYIEELRSTLDPHNYDPIIVVEPADRGNHTGAKGTVLDGNRRAIALAMEGLSKIDSIVGDRAPRRR